MGVLVVNTLAILTWDILDRERFGGMGVSGDRGDSE